MIYPKFNIDSIPMEMPWKDFKEWYDKANIKLDCGFHKRPNVWTIEQAARYVENTMLGIPTDRNIYFIMRLEKRKMAHMLLDGKQRINAVLRFLNNEFNIQGKFYKDMTGLNKYCVFFVHIFTLEDDDLIIEWYNRKNKFL